MFLFRLHTEGKPHNWVHHQGYGKKAYDPKYLQKEQTKWQIKTAYHDDPIQGNVSIRFIFYFPVPKGTSCVRRRQMLNGVIRPGVSPDCTNMQKFYEDCLKKIVFEDDSRVVDISSSKFYSAKPGVLIKVLSSSDNYQLPCSGENDE